MKLKTLRKLVDEAYEKALMEREEAYDNALIDHIVAFFNGQLVPVWLLNDHVNLPYYAKLQKNEVEYWYNNRPIWMPLYYKEPNDLIVSWYPKMVEFLGLPKFFTRNEWCELYPINKEDIRKRLLNK
jgi:hypothetical protein